MIPEEVIIDGVKFAPVATSIRFSYMHENHTFQCLTGDTIEDIVKNATHIAEQSPYGMLCPAIIFSGEKELRKVGRSVHHDSGRPDKWRQKCRDWLTEVIKDPDALRLIGLGH